MIRIALLACLALCFGCSAIGDITPDEETYRMIVPDLVAEIDTDSITELLLDQSGSVAPGGSLHFDSADVAGSIQVTSLAIRAAGSLIAR